MFRVLLDTSHSRSRMPSPLPTLATERPQQVASMGSSLLQVSCSHWRTESLAPPLGLSEPLSL